LSFAWSTAEKRSPISISFIVVIRLRFKFFADGCRAPARDFVANSGRDPSRHESE
jgi:hypothetical protein